MAFEYQKAKSASKVVRTGKQARGTVLETMELVASVVGSTLGPGGRPVLLERQEHGLPAAVTKDGVTVFRSLGLEDPVAHVVLEAARDAAVRTAGEAGDGTTTATVLAAAIVRRIGDHCRDNPRSSPQRVVRRLEKLFKDVVEPTLLNEASRAVLPDDPENVRSSNLWKVARISANGDGELADAVMSCLDYVGDDGNVTIVEVSGPSKYEVEPIDGYPIEVGYEDSCGKFFPKFINDPGTQRCVLENPVFVLYHGRITEIQTLVPLMEAIGSAWGSSRYEHHNVVVFATGFSESVLAQLALNFVQATTINVLPMLVPRSPLANGQQQYLLDLAAVTGALVHDPLSAPLEAAAAEFAQLDTMDPEEIPGRFEVLLGPGVKTFECSRYRANIVGRPEGGFVADDGTQHSYPELVEARASELESLLEKPESEQDAVMLRERLGKLTQGIARLKVVGSSAGELREKRDRAEDAVCAVRGAIKHGVLPGGGWGLLRARYELLSMHGTDPVVQQVLGPALEAPIELLLANAGVPEDEAEQILARLEESVAGGLKEVYDANEGVFADADQIGLLDSLPAVLEAVRNSLSIASLLGTLGGVVAFPRDRDFERSEARDTADFLRSANVNEADERA